MSALKLPSALSRRGLLASRLARARYWRRPWHLGEPLQSQDFVDQAHRPAHTTYTTKTEAIAEHGHKVAPTTAAGPSRQ